MSATMPEIRRDEALRTDQTTALRTEKPRRKFNQRLKSAFFSRLLERNTNVKANVSI
jgi:hypothetical protein